MARVTRALATNYVSSANPQTYTQTYATAARTNPAMTATAVATTAAALAAYGYSQAQADSIPVAINALTVDLLAVKQLVNGIVDDLQAKGLAA